MKRSLIVGLLMLTLGSALAKDHSNDYQMGTFISATAVADGTITSTLRGDGTTVAGDVYRNSVGVYRIKVADGTWIVTTLSQNQDAMLRSWGMTPSHFKSEKANPLDFLKTGDKVLFRLHERHYLNRKVTLMAIPYADKPDKEVDFTTRFVPDVAPAKPDKPTDNVKAMCDAHKLSPELEKQLCTAVAQAPAVETPAVQGTSIPADYATARYNMCVKGASRAQDPDARVMMLHSCESLKPENAKVIYENCMEQAKHPLRPDVTTEMMERTCQFLKP